MKIRLFLVAALTSMSAFAADSTPVFNAMLTVGQEHRFVLVSQPEGKASSFLRLGETFDGYVLKAYEVKTGTLDLERGGKVTPVTLVADAAIANAPVSSPATLADATAVMNKMHMDDLLERTMTMQKKAIMASIERSMGAKIPPELKADYLELQKQIAAEVGSRLDAKAMKDDLARIYSETFTREDLEGMSAFYDTPLGKVMLAKQPEVQEKMQQAMVPRVAELTAKIQDMSREFFMQQKAKREGGGAANVPAPTPTPATPATKG
jgi:hypothetical protein